MVRKDGATGITAGIAAHRIVARLPLRQSCAALLGRRACDGSAARVAVDGIDDEDAGRGWFPGGGRVGACRQRLKVRVRHNLAHGVERVGCASAQRAPRALQRAVQHVLDQNLIRGWNHVQGEALLVRVRCAVVVACSSSLDVGDPLLVRHALEKLHAGYDVACDRHHNLVGQHRRQDVGHLKCRLRLHRSQLRLVTGRRRQIVGVRQHRPVGAHLWPRPLQQLPAVASHRRGLRCAHAWALELEHAGGAVCDCPILAGHGRHRQRVSHHVA